MTEKFTISERIWRFIKIYKGIDVPYWIMDKDGNDVLFHYDDEDKYKRFLKQRIKELSEQWRQEHPFELLNRDAS